MDEQNRITELTATIAVLNERLDAARQLIQSNTIELREANQQQFADLRRQLEDSTNGWRTAMENAAISRQTEITQLTNTFHASLEKITANFTEQSKNYVLQAEFGTVRYIIITLILGFMVQAIAKYLFKW